MTHNICKKKAAVILSIVTLMTNSSNSHFCYTENWLYFSYSIFCYI